MLVETEIGPDLGFEAPPPTYPLERVEQPAYHGAAHGFVNTTTGGFVFRMVDMRLPGRMPIEFGRVYDSNISISMPPPPPGRYTEQRTTEDLGLNWLPSYASYLIQDIGSYRMATAEGYIVEWEHLGNGVYGMKDSVPGPHQQLVQVDSMTVVETRLDGSRWTFKRQTSGYNYFLTKIEDRSGNYIVITYTQGYMSKIENSDGSFFDITRPMFLGGPPPAFPATRITKVTDNTGRFIELDYNADGMLTEVTDVRGKTWTFGYDLAKKLALASDPLGNSYLTALIDTSYRSAAYEANDGYWTFAYDPVNRFTVVEDAFENAWEYHYTADGMPYQILEPTGGLHELELDTLLNPIQHTDPEGVVSTWTYDTDHRPLTYSPPGTGPNPITYTYDPVEGWVDSVTSLSGGVRTFTRDAAGRVLEEEAPDGGTWEATYDPATGDRLTLTTPKGHQWSFEYDDFGQVTEATDPTGRVFKFVYTAYGDLAEFWKPDHRDAANEVVYATWIYTRDEAGRITAITDPLGNTWTRVYDDAGRLIEQQGPAGTTVRYTYDVRHRLTSAALIDGENDPTTSYGYDAAGRLTSKTLPTGSTWTYDYDASSRLIGVTDPLQRSWTYERDDAGRVASITYPGGREVTLTRDASGRLVTRTIPGGRVESFAYDAETGRLIEAEVDLGDGDWIGRIAWTHDSMDRPTSASTEIDDGSQTLTRTLTYTYDLNGNRETLASAPLGETLTFAYDELDRLVGTDSDLYEDWTIVYDPDSGHRREVSTPSRSKSWEFDLAGRMHSEVWDWPEGNALVEYSYDAEGRPTAYEDAVSQIEVDLAYNELGLVTSIERSLAGVQQSIDTRFYDEAGQLEKRVTQSELEPTVTLRYDWDAAGRLIAASHNGDLRVYEWDDAPADAASALKISRIATDPLQSNVELHYGYDGRLRETWHQAKNEEEPSLTAAYIWSPLEADLALQVKTRVGPEEFDTRVMAIDVGGYYGDLTAAFTDGSLYNPILLEDVAREALRLSTGTEVPAPMVPLGLGRWPGLLNRTGKRSSEATLSGVATAIIEGKVEQGLALAEEQRGLRSLETLDDFVAASTDAYDDWLGAPVFGGSSLGDRSQLLSHAGITSWQSAWPEAGLESGELESQDTQSHGSLGLYSFCLCQDNDVAFQPVWEAWHTLGCCDGMLHDPPYYSNPSPIACEYAAGLSNAHFPAPVRYESVSEGGVTLVNGDFTHSETDLVVPAPGGDIVFGRSYRSLLDYEGAFGHGWLHNWQEVLSITPPNCHSTTSECQVTCGDTNFDGFDDCSGECGGQHFYVAPLVVWVSRDGRTESFEIPETGSLLEGDDSSTYRARYQASTDEFVVSERGGEDRIFERLAAPGTTTYRLKAVTEGESRTELVYADEQSFELTRIDSVIDGAATPRVLLSWTADGRLDDVQSALDPSDIIDYGYDDCGRLVSVFRPTPQLGDGATLPDHPQTETRYTYTFPGSGGAVDSCPATFLHSVAVEQYDPHDPSPPYFKTLFKTKYQLPQGANSNVTAHWQCLSPDSCAADQADLRYTYHPSSQPQNHYTEVLDKRYPSPGRLDRYEFQYAVKSTTKIIEDVGGLERVTKFEYINPGLLSRKRLPDGSCEEYKYVNKGNVWLPWMITLRTADRCGLAPHASDIVTLRTYDDVKGALRSETGPDAFPNGCTLTDYSQVDPMSSSLKPYTTFFYYEFDERASCTSAGPQQQDLNGDGKIGTCVERLIKTARLDPSQAGEVYLTKLYSYDKYGRLETETGVDNGTVPWGERQHVEYEYYNSKDGAWDWRAGDAFGDEDAPGPLARTEVRGKPGMPPGETLTVEAGMKAWSPRGWLIAARNSTGVVTEHVLSTAGTVVETRVCRLSGAEEACPTYGDNLLRTTYNKRDLLGRLLGTRVEDGSGAELGKQLFAYDDAGRVTVSTVDPGGLDLTSRNVFDELGRVVRTVTPEGRTTCAEYDNLDRQVASWTVAHQLPNEVEPCAGGPDLEGEDADPVVRMTYDAMDRVTGVRQPTGEWTYSWYDEHGRLEFVSDGRPTVDGGSAPEITDPIYLGAAPEQPGGGHWWSQSSYDKSGRSTRELFYGRRNIEPHESGYLSIGWMQYDTLGRATTSTVGIADNFIPPEAVSAEPMAGNGVEFASTTVIYDSQGRRSAIRDPLGRETSLEYDCLGRQYRTLFPAAERVCWSGPNETANPCSANEDCAAGEQCLPSTASAAKRDARQTTYNELGQVIEEESIVHDPEGNPHHQKQQLAYDPWGRIRRVVGDPDGAKQTIDYGYDARDLQTSQVMRWKELGLDQTSDVSDPLDRKTESEFDRASRLTEQRNWDGSGWRTTVYGYDRDGAVKTLTDANGNTTTWVYDAALGRLLRMLYPLNGGAHQVVELANHDFSGRPHAVIFKEPEAAPEDTWLTWTLDYDDRGRLISREATLPTAASSPPFAGTMRQEFHFDDLGRLVRSTDRSVTGEAAHGEDVYTLFRYDTGGRVREQELWLPPDHNQKHVVRSTFLPDGFRSKLEFPDATDSSGALMDRYEIGFQADGMGRLVGITGPDTPAEPWQLVPLVAFERFGAATWSRSNLNNGTTDAFQFDGLGRLQGQSSSLAGNSFLDFRYGYDRVGNLAYEQRRHEPMGGTPATFRTRAYSMNLLGQLTAWSEGALPADPIAPTAVDPAGTISAPSAQETWQLDPLGNWRTHTATNGGVTEEREFRLELEGTELGANELNQYQFVATGGSAAEEFVHDFLGSLRESESRNQRYVWDAFGRLDSVYNRTSGTLIVRYRYDAHNRRVQKFVPSGVSGLDAMTVRFVYDGWRAIEERVLELTSQGWWEPVRARYGFGLALDEVLWMDRDIATNGGQPDPINGETDDVIESRFFVHHDYRGSAGALTSESGTVVERYTYSAYGETRVWAGEEWNASGGYGQPRKSHYAFPYMFTGQRLDSESGVYYFKHRYYDPANGNFLRRDPFGYRGGINLYQYAYSAPQQFVDPFGLTAYVPGIGTVSCGYLCSESDKERIPVGGSGKEEENKCIGPHCGDWEITVRVLETYIGSSGNPIVTDFEAAGESVARSQRHFDNPRRRGGYLGEAFRQVVLGDYTEDVNALGTAGQIGLGIVGLDLPADIRDISHSIQHWEWSWSHVGKTTLNVAGLLPIVGSLKYADEAMEVAARGIDNGRTLYRAVGADELADIQAAGRYRVPEGMSEGKYFFETPEQASSFARQMGDQPYTTTSVTVSPPGMAGAQPINPAGEGPGFFFATPDVPSGPVTVYNHSVLP